MKILAVDVGTGTQDIILFDTHLDIENAYKLILPAPTMMIHRRIQEATQSRIPVHLFGVMMGGGPSQWAAEAHVQAGLPIYATPDAARTFNDDLNIVSEMGIQIVSEDEALRLPEDVLRLELGDFNFAAIRSAFSRFGVRLDDLAAVAVAVFDHGNAPPTVSDRQFRFDYLNERIIATNRLSAFAYLENQIPSSMTRLQAVAKGKELPAPLVVMDTAPAAVLGASFDAHTAALSRAIILNVGNFHTLAFRLGQAGIEGVFEHHTGLIDLPHLETLLRKLADGSLTQAEVYDEHGHGALIYTPEPLVLDPQVGNLVVTGPRRGLLRHSLLKPYFAAPFGDMMVAGCFGLLAATADLLPDLNEPVMSVLRNSSGTGHSPWDFT